MLLPFSFPCASIELRSADIVALLPASLKTPRIYGYRRIFYVFIYGYMCVYIFIYLCIYKYIYIYVHLIILIYMCIYIYIWQRTLQQSQFHTTRNTPSPGSSQEILHELIRCMSCLWPHWQPCRCRRRCPHLALRATAGRRNKAWRQHT